MGGAYRVGPGIRLNPMWAAVFADLAFILAAGFGAYCITDYTMSELLGALAQMDEALQVVCSLMYLPCLLFLAAFAARMGCQTLEITPEAVTRHGPGGRRMLPWERIQGFELKNSHVMVRPRGHDDAAQIADPVGDQDSGGRHRGGGSPACAPPRTR